MSAYSAALAPPVRAKCCPARRAASHKLAAPEPFRPRLQARLEIGAASDPLEHEADATAERIMRMRDPGASLSSTSPRIQRQCSSCAEQENRLQRQPAAPQVPAIVHEVLSTQGRPLDADTRTFFEPRFRRDFSGVRVHDDNRAARSAATIGAAAYTFGSDIVFGTGRFEPQSARGKQLLAHELAHVVQQRGDTGTARIRRQSNPAVDRQIACVIENGACAVGPQDRDGGIADSGDIATYNKTCRETGKTGYDGPDLTPTAEQCQNPPKPSPTPSAPAPAQGWTTGEKVALGAIIGTALIVGAVVVVSVASGGTLAPLALAAVMTVDAAAPAALTAAAVDAGVTGTIVLVDVEIVGGSAAAAAATEGTGVIGTALMEASLTGAAAPAAVAPAVAAPVGQVVVAESSSAAVTLAKAAGLTLAAGSTLSGDGPKPSQPKDEKKKEDSPDRCETLLGLRRGVNARRLVQRPAINGNVTVSEGLFRLDAGVPPPPGQRTSTASRGWARTIAGAGHPSDDAGHVIAKRFGGTNRFNQSPDGNIFPQHRVANQEIQNGFEAVIADRHKAGCDVCGHVLLGYDSAAALRPNRVILSILYRSPGAKQFNPPLLIMPIENP